MITATIEGGDLDIAALIEEDLSPDAQSAQLADFAQRQLADAEKVNAAPLGFTPQHTVAVDGVPGASEDRARPDGEIVYTFDLMPDVFAWIAAELEAFAPVRSGRFKLSFAFFVDGIAADPAGEIPEGREFVFLSSVLYAGKIEGEHKSPESRQAPNGVFEAVAALAQMRFPQLDISFSYRESFGGAATSIKDTPAIIIALGSA
jgi:hypothetical protein